MSFSKLNEVLELLMEFAHFLAHVLAQKAIKQPTEACGYL